MDGSDSHVNFIRKKCTFPEVVSSEKRHVTKNLGLPQLVKIFRSQTPAHCERDYSKHDSELFIKSVSFKVFWGLTSPMA